MTVGFVKLFNIDLLLLLCQGTGALSLAQAKAAKYGKHVSGKLLVI